MIESFVDLTYRGLSLGRRVKLSQVRPTSGWLEVAAPMPVGTALVITTDEGLTVDAKVISIREQIGGSDHAPGMEVTPALVDADRVAWWAARVAATSAPVMGETAAPAATTVMMAVVEAEVEGGATTVMPAVDPQLLEQLAGEGDAPHAIHDDGARTVVMDAIDPAALGLEPPTSAGVPRTLDDVESGPVATGAGPATPGPSKKRRKRR